MESCQERCGEGMNDIATDIKHHYNWGNLLEAEALAKKAPDLEISKTVFERMADIRHWTKHGKPHGYCDPKSWESMPKFQKTLDAIQAKYLMKGVRVLDVGCFTGFFSRQLNDLGYDAHGCDIQDKLMRMLNMKHCTKGLHKYHPVAAENIGRYFKEETFDVVTFLDSLEHILDDKMSVDAAKRLIVPGGLMVIHVPQGEKYPDDAHEHLRIYTEDSLKDLLPGIVIEEFKDENGKPTFFGTWVKGVLV